MSISRAWFTSTALKVLRGAGAALIATALALAPTAVLSLAAPSEGLAQDKGKPAAKKGKSKEYSFEDDVIETQYLRPDTANVEGISKNKRASLIRIRMNFFAELVRSAEDL